MQALGHKLRIVFLPFLLIAIGCVVGYSFLDWLLIIKTGYTGLSEEVVNFWLPFGLPWIPIHVWLRPRLKALRFSGGGVSGRDWPSFFSMMAAFAIVVPTIVGQFYLETATGAMSDLARIEQIDAIPRTKYYTVRDVGFVRNQASMATSAKLTGRYNDTLRLAVYIVCPISDATGRPAPTCRHWLGTVFNTSMSSRLSEDEKQARYRAFVRQSAEDYGHMDLRAFTYLERVGISDDRKGLEDAVRLNPAFPPGTAITVLIAHHDRFSERNGSKLAWVFGSLGIGAAVWFTMLAFAPVDRTEMNRLLRGEEAKTDRSFAWLRFFRPSRGYFVTPILIDLNVLVFVAMVLAGLGFMSFSASDLFTWGGNLRSAVVDGQYWRLLTSMFVHGGMMHLFGNLFGLFLAGMLLEPVFGRGGFALCYLLSGVAGGVASIGWHAATVSVGASGAVFGLMGAIIGFSVLNRSRAALAGKHVIGFVLYFLGFNLLFGLLGGGTDNADHLGGLAGGVTVGVFFHLFPSLLPRQRRLATRVKNAGIGS